MPVFITSHQLLSFPPTHTRLTATHYKRFFAVMPLSVPDMQLQQKNVALLSTSNATFPMFN